MVLEDELVERLKIDLRPLQGLIVAMKEAFLLRSGDLFVIVNAGPLAVVDGIVHEHLDCQSLILFKEFIVKLSG